VEFPASNDTSVAYLTSITAGWLDGTPIPKLPLHGRLKTHVIKSSCAIKSRSGFVPYRQEDLSYTDEKKICPILL